MDPDARASRQVALGFEREGVPATVVAVPAVADAAKLELPPDGGDAGLVVVGGVDGRALDLVRRTRSLLEAARIDAPIVFAGRGVRRTDAEAAGADEVVLQPAYLRDVVTIGRLMRGVPSHQRAHIVGSLAELTGVFTLVRALSALGRSAVLTLIRGLRRGEVRFFHGEVTSAQVGLIHGQAALHQLLLWTDARFDFHHEDIVRRQQIPMTHEELFADAERFLAGVRDCSGPLSPSMVLEQDVARVQSLGRQIPTEVHGVLRMFDGHRVLADVLEDSPYRVFETLRVAQRALEIGLLRVAQGPKQKATWRAVLAIEEWLVGSETRDGVIERQAADAPESGPIDATGKKVPAGGGGGSRRKRKKRRAQTPLVVTPATSKPEIDWGALVPRIVGAEVGPLAGVVPAAHASGEITPKTRGEPRERLEAVMDTHKRERIFPTDVGLEPKVVWDEKAADADAERARREAFEADVAAAHAAAASAAAAAEKQAAEAKAQAAEEAAAAKAADEAAAKKAANEAAAKKAADEAAAKTASEKKAADEAAAKKAADEAAAKKAADEAAAKKAADEAAAKKAADEAAAKKAAEEATAKKAAEEAAAKKAAEEAAAKKAAEEAAAKAAAEKRAADEVAAKAAAEKKAAEEAAEKAAEEAAAKKAADEAAEKKAAEEAAEKAAAEKKAAEEAAADEARAAAEKKAAAEAEALAARMGRPEKLQSAKGKARAEAKARKAAERAKAAEAAKAVADKPAVRDANDDAEAAERVDAARAIAASISTTEPSAGALVKELVTEAGVAALPSEAPAQDGAPAAVDDEPSDGVVREIGVIETAPVARRPPPGPIPVDDRPEDATGEITAPVTRDAHDLPPAEPSILVADLAAAHTAVSALAAQHATAPAPDMATPAQEATVAEVQHDAAAAATAFTDAEEDFFRAGHEKEKSGPPTAGRFASDDSFDDLDEGYQPVGFWDRLLGRKKPRR
ncbi:MAG: DUF4388 domain-containing protein [Deltaproteobacteria bacterium]|nr:DUF4388 domain-containing protein [Deltaproteobacteria bacterium]